VNIQDDTELGRGDKFVIWVIKRQVKLLNFIEQVFFIKRSANKIAAGEMKLGTIEDFQLNSILSDSFHDDAVIQIAKCCPALRKFHLSSCANITNFAITKIAECCPMLLSLSLSGRRSITDFAIKIIAHYCPMLEYLHLDSWIPMTDAAIIRIAACCPKLKYLDLFGEIRDIAIIRIAKSCQILQTLNLNIRHIAGKHCRVLPDARAPLLVQ
jgi:hypothetical protein